MTVGKRNRQIAIERATVTVDDYGGETATWAVYATVRAEVLFGTGQERREAAQEQAQQSATFIVAWSPLLDAVEVHDRISFDGSDWDITNIAPVGLNKELHFTAVRAR